MGFHPKSQTRPLFLYFKGWEYKLCRDGPSPPFFFYRDLHFIRWTLKISPNRSPKGLNELMRILTGQAPRNQ